jgi:hypothetical protein
MNKNKKYVQEILQKLPNIYWRSTLLKSNSIKTETICSDIEIKRIKMGSKL